LLSSVRTHSYLPSDYLLIRDHQNFAAHLERGGNCWTMNWIIVSVGILVMKLCTAEYYVHDDCRILYFYLFVHLISNQVSILRYNSVLSDTYKQFSIWSMIQELWLLLKETEISQHLTINFDTKPNRVLQTGGVWLHYDVLRILSTTKLGWVNFLVHLWIWQTFSSYYLDTCKNRKTLCQRVRNVKMLCQFWEFCIEKYSFRDWRLHWVSG